MSGVRRVKMATRALHAQSSRKQPLHDEVRRYARALALLSLILAGCAADAAPPTGTADPGSAVTPPVASPPSGASNGASGSSGMPAVAQPMAMPVGGSAAPTMPMAMPSGPVANP